MNFRKPPKKRSFQHNAISNLTVHPVPLTPQLFHKAIYFENSLTWKQTAVTEAKKIFNIADPTRSIFLLPVYQSIQHASPTGENSKATTGP